MIKKQNRIIYKLKKIRTGYILLVSGLVFPVIFHGHSSADNYSPDISNPFHDVFYSYNHNERAKAKRLLKKQFSSAIKNQAYINYGLINEYEGNYAEAEKYYREALKNDEKISIIYLYNLYIKHNPERTLPLLLAVENHIQSFWIDYEKAVDYIGKNDRNMALSSLTQAIDKGFSSTDLLMKDTAFDSIRSSFAFKRLIKKAEKNYSVNNSINERMKNLEYEHNMDKPYGKISELDTAAYFESSGKERKALKILSSALRSKKLSYRDRGIALFWLARINAKNGKEQYARQYLQDFIDHITGQGIDTTGFKDIIGPVYKDVVLNDPFLKKIADKMIE